MIDPKREAARLGRPTFRAGRQDDEPTFELVWPARIER
jgi:hypothetical protein